MKNSLISEPITNLLKSVDIFKTLSNEELQEIAKIMCRQKFEKGTFVFSENDPGQKLFIVEDGELSLFLSGRPVVSYEVGDLFGEIALINGSIRTGSVKAMKKSVLLCIEESDLVNRAKISPETAFKIFRQLAIKVTSYLRPKELTTTSELIREGESDTVEFKSTLRYNLYTKKKGKEIEHAALKTVAAFLNTDGGTLLVGVNDQGEILGIENDKFPNDDKILLHFTKMVNDRISMQHMSFIDCYVDVIDNMKVLRIDVKPANTPAYLEDNNEEKFYIRTGPSTSSLRVSEHYDYVRTRFSHPLL